MKRLRQILLIILGFVLLVAGSQFQQLENPIGSVLAFFVFLPMGIAIIILGILYD